MFKKILFPSILLLFAYFILTHDNAKMIVAGVAIFLVGMLFMEDGFKLLSGKALEQILAKFTNNLPKAIFSGIVATSIVQSSTLTSIIMISFLSAGLVGLAQAIGVIFGANIGSTTTIWIVSYFGLKIDIALYSMPMLIFGVILKFTKSTKYQGVGNILLGLGFVFLGIDYMKGGFETLKETIDLASYAMSGYLGVLVYVLVGAIATIVIQSSAATMVIVITALASGQIEYQNALALAIGANLGTSISTMLGAITSNENGRRLVIAHFIFNSVTAIFSIIFIYQITVAVDIIANSFGVASNDYVIKLAIFHTFFNVIGIILVAPFTNQMVKYLETLFIPKVKSKSKPLYLNEEAMSIPSVALICLKKEVLNLYFQGIKAISHAISLHRTDIFGDKNLKDIVQKSNTKIETNIDEIYKENLKHLYGEIINFSSLTQSNMDDDDRKIVGKLENVSRKIIKSLKEVKELQRNIDKYMKSTNKEVKNEYNEIREIVANTLREAEYIREHKLDDVDRVSRVEAVKDRLYTLDEMQNGKIQKLVRDKKIDISMATSLINDASFALYICKRLIDVTMILWIEDKLLLELGEDELI